MTRQPTPDVLSELLASPQERVQQIELHLLDPNPFQRRTTAVGQDDPAMQELTMNIVANGILQPLIVRYHATHHGRYQIAAGHRRLAAATLAGLDSVPCVVRTLTDAAMLDVVFAENYHRADINPIDRAQLMAMLAAQGLTHQQIADRFSISRPAVSNAMRLLQLPEDIQAEVNTGAITQRQAEAMLPLLTLPASALENAPTYATDLPSIKRAALYGASSDRLREMAAAALRDYTKPIPQHWGNMVFTRLAGIHSLRCTDCPVALDVQGEKRCADLTCWNLKSSDWQAIEHANAVTRSRGVPILPENTPYFNKTELYTHDRALLNLPDPPDPPPDPRCQNLYLRLGFQGNSWNWVCLHPPGKKHCTCLRAASRAQAKDGAAVWKQVRAQTTQALADALALWPETHLALTGAILDGAFTPATSKYHGKPAADIASSLAVSLIDRSAPSDPAVRPDSARKVMADLLSLAGVRPPWLPPLVEEIAEQMRYVDAFISDYNGPADKLPTPESVDGVFDTLDQILTSINALAPEDAPSLWRHQHADLTNRLAALSDRVQASYTETEE